MNLDIRLENTWKQQLTEEFDKPYFSALMQFLAQEKENGKTIFPKENNIFNAYNSTPFNKVKVVIIGQDP
ncbi:uracil-DNA glycosylase, partial [bacterium]|nr:uracil-DNA glycosylase [bacterium]